MPMTTPRFTNLQTDGEPMPEATELEFLKWFWINADFGPADSDVKAAMIEEFERQKGTRVPGTYREGWFE